MQSLNIFYLFYISGKLETTMWRGLMKKPIIEGITINELKSSQHQL